MVHHSTYSYKVTLIYDQLFFSFCTDRQTHAQTDRQTDRQRDTRTKATSRNNTCFAQIKMKCDSVLKQLKSGKLSRTNRVVRETTKYTGKIKNT